MADDDRGPGGPPNRDRPRGGRPSGGRPTGGRPYGGKPPGDRPYGDRQWRPPRGGSYRDRSGGERPAGSRPYGARPYGGRPSGGRPYGDRPPGQRPWEDRPQADRPPGSGPQRGMPSRDRWPDRRSGGPPPPVEWRRPDRGTVPGDPVGRPPGARPGERAGQGRPSGGPSFRPRPASSRPPGQRSYGGPPDRSAPRPRRDWQPIAAVLAGATPDGPAPVERLSEDEEIVAGRRPVEEAFAARREARRLLVVPERRSALDQLVLHATTLRIPVVEVEGGTITAISGFDGHQGVALVVAPRRWATLDDVLALARTRGEPALVLVLDHLEDPQNVGTLLRSAEACGVHGVLFPTQGAAPISPAAIKASAGAVEHLLLVPMTDLPGGLVDLHARGVRIVGADGDAALTVREVDMRGPLAIVIGSEGRGLNARVRRRVDIMARTPCVDTWPRSTPRWLGRSSSSRPLRSAGPACPHHGTAPPTGRPTGGAGGRGAAGPGSLRGWGRGSKWLGAAGRGA